MLSYSYQMAYIQAGRILWRNSFPSVCSKRRSDLFSSFHLAKYSAFGTPFTVFDMEIEQQASVGEKEVHPLNPESNSEKDVNPSFPFVLRFHCIEQNQTMK